MRIVLDFGVQTREIESVEDVVLLDFAEIFIALGRQEPRYPLL